MKEYQCWCSKCAKLVNLLTIYLHVLPKNVARKAMKYVRIAYVGSQARRGECTCWSIQKN